MLTASIVIYNSPKKDIQTAITCVDNSIVNTIYVIDNATDDNLKEFVQGLSKKIVYIQGQGNVGHGVGHNIGIRKAIEGGAIYHAVINPDVAFETGVLEKLSEFMDVHSNAGLVMPKAVSLNGELQYLCKLIPTPLDLISKRFLPAKMTKKRMQRFQLKFTGYDKVMNIPYLSGCFMFFRTSVLEEIGLFDERFFLYPEDIDITRRIHEKYETLFCPDVQIVHAHAAESYVSKRVLGIHIMNIVLYFNKWGWFFDKKRNKINKKVLNELGFHSKK